MKLLRVIALLMLLACPAFGQVIGNVPSPFGSVVMSAPANLDVFAVNGIYVN